MSSSCASSWTPVARTTHPSMDFCGWPYPSSLLVSLRRSYRSFRECLTSASMMSAFSKPRPWWRRRQARARVYICVSSKSFHFEERERERQKCVPNRSSFSLRVKGVCVVVVLLLLLLFARILLLKSRRFSRRRRRTFCRFFPSVRPRSSSKLLLVSMWQSLDALANVSTKSQSQHRCLSLYMGRSCCLCREREGFGSAIFRRRRY